MAITFAKALGIHDDALVLRAKRAEIISNNLVNAETPGFLARDIDFKQVLKQVDPNDKNTFRMSKTNNGHLGILEDAMDADLKYRNPFMPSEDGNTVSTEGEYMRFAENSVRYQASLRFINGKLDGLRRAIKGD